MGLRYNGRDLVAEAWGEYRADVLPIAAGRTQVIETRRAFYAGVWALLRMEKGFAASDESDDEVVASLEAIEQECIKFKENVGTPAEYDY